MGFLIQKFVSALLMPVPLLLLAAAWGWAAWARGKHPRRGKALVATAVAALWLLGTGPVADGLLRAVEGPPASFPGDSVAYVVVLGHGHDSDPALSSTARLQDAALYRLTEGVRLAVAQPWSTLVLSGYGGSDPKPSAQAYADLAMELGVPAARIRLEPRPRTTAEEAELLAPLLSGQRFALVTSASHMRRASALFRGRGLDPIPAPTGYGALRDPDPGPERLLPKASNLVKARTAWRETLGLAWAWMRGEL